MRSTRGTACGMAGDRDLECTSCVRSFEPIDAPSIPKPCSHSRSSCACALASCARFAGAARSRASVCRARDSSAVSRFRARSADSRRPRRAHRNVAALRIRYRARAACPVWAEADEMTARGRFVVLRAWVLERATRVTLPGTRLARQVVDDSRTEIGSMLTRGEIRCRRDPAVAAHRRDE